MRAGDDAKFFRAGDPDEGGKVLHVLAVGPASLGVVNVGEPFQLERLFSCNIDGGKEFADYWEYQMVTLILNLLLPVRVLPYNLAVGELCRNHIIVRCSGHFAPSNRQMESMLTPASKLTFVRTTRS